MPSIFQQINGVYAQELSDAVVVSVFMGLVKERVTAGRQVKIGYKGGFQAYTKAANQYRSAQARPGKAAGQDDVDAHGREVIKLDDEDQYFN